MADPLTDPTPNPNASVKETPMKRRLSKRNRRDKAPRIICVPTEQRVVIAKQCRGSQVLLDVYESPDTVSYGDVPFSPIRITRHAKDGRVILHRSPPVEIPREVDGEVQVHQDGTPQYETVILWEVWDMEVSA